LATEEVTAHYEDGCWFCLYTFRVNLWMQVLE